MTPVAEAATSDMRPLCPDVETWVQMIYAPTYVRPITQTQRWCASWWEHAEAIVRLECLWRTWEAARISPDGCGIADWLRGYLDPINAVLLSADTGPFTSCTPDRHAPRPPMPLLPAPPGYWREDADLDPQYIDREEYA